MTESESTTTTTKSASSKAKSEVEVDVSASPESYLSGITLKDGLKMRFCPTCHEKPLSRIGVDPKTKKSVQIRICPLQQKDCGFIK